MKCSWTKDKKLSKWLNKQMYFCKACHKVTDDASFVQKCVKIARVGNMSTGLK